MSNCRNMTPEQRHALIAQMPKKAPTPRQCEHIKANGEFCGSPALRNRHHCFFHLTHIGRKIRAERAHQQALARSLDATAATLELPPLEDANSIQVALMQVTDAVLHNRIDPTRARLVLRALQIARANLANGADFCPVPGATVAGRYEQFEQDFQIEEDTAILQIDEDEIQQQADAHAAELARIEELAEAYERVAVAREKAEKRIAARSAAGEDTEADEQELAAVEGEGEFRCHPVEQLLCKIFGPRARDCDPGPTVIRPERDAPSQRLELWTTQEVELKKAA